MKRYLFTVWIVGLFTVLGSSPVLAKTIYKSKYNEVKIIPAKEDLTGGEALDHPQNIDEAKIYNMLASLHFDKRSLLFKDKEDVRLLDQRGLKLLSPYLAKAFAEMGSDEVVYFQYIKKAPHIRVLRNDRLIVAECFIRNGELFIRFKKMYAKIFGDYQRAGEERKLNRAKDIRVNFRPRGGQRTISEEFIALRIDHDYKTDLEQEALVAERAKEEAKEAETIRGVPLPQVGTAKEEETPKKAAKKPKKSKTKKETLEKAEPTPTEGESEIIVRLKTLDELKEKKLITNKEYKEKKKEILESL